MTTLKVGERRKLQALHKKVIAGERARIDRDLMILDLYQDGVSQIDMAEVLDEQAQAEEWDQVTRNSVQKIVSRQRSMQDVS